MIKGMYFIYSLTHNGNIFYIGKTENLAKRYSSHLKRNLKTPCGRYISETIKKEEYPDINIMDYLPAKEAEKMEGYLISVFSRAGHKLQNGNMLRGILHTPPNIPTIKTPKIMRKIAAYKQAAELHHYICCHWEAKCKYTFHYPANPF